MPELSPAHVLSMSAWLLKAAQKSTWQYRHLAALQGLWLHPIKGARWHLASHDHRCNEKADRESNQCFPLANLADDVVADLVPKEDEGHDPNRHSHDDRRQNKMQQCLHDFTRSVARHPPSSPRRYTYCHGERDHAVDAPR